MKISQSRKEAIKNYPISKFNLVCLNIPQAEESFIPNNWFNKKYKYISLKTKSFFQTNLSSIIKKINF